MLYHPCANPLEVERLRNLVNKCLWRHIITPYSYLDEERVSIVLLILIFSLTIFSSNFSYLVLIICIILITYNYNIYILFLKV